MHVLVQEVLWDEEGSLQNVCQFRKLNGIRRDENGNYTFLHRKENDGHQLRFFVHNRIRSANKKVELLMTGFLYCSQESLM